MFGVMQSLLNESVSSNHLSTRNQNNQEAEFAEVLITSRQNISPKRLIEPGPNVEQMESIFRAVAAAPDHGLLTPWRFVLVPLDKRVALAEVFALALVDRDPGATLEQIEAARDKAHRAPFLALAVARLGPCETNIPVLERMVSVGAAIQNMLLSSYSLGFGSGLTSGQAMKSNRMRDLFELNEGEEAVCFVNIGTVSKRKMPRIRPSSNAFVSTL